MQINSYEVWHKDFPEFQQTHTATSPSKARYEAFLSAEDVGWDVSYIDFRSRKLPSLVPNVGFEHVKNIRRMPFVEIGMKIKFDGDYGYIVGAGSGANWEVIMETGTSAGNQIYCHPRWQMTYFNKDGKILVEYVEKTSAEGQARLDKEIANQCAK